LATNISGLCFLLVLAALLLTRAWMARYLTQLREKIKALVDAKGWRKIIYQKIIYQLIEILWRSPKGTPLNYLANLLLGNSNKLDPPLPPAVLIGRIFSQKNSPQKVEL
jgi:hypothetical protein